MNTPPTKPTHFSLSGWPGVALLLSLMLLTLQAGFLINQPWVGDYWEHRAVLLELLQHPFHPQHPVVRSEQPHPFYSPYLVGWALAGRTVGATVVPLLNTMAVTNLLLWLGAVWLLTRMFLPRRNTAHSFVILLLTLLFCWGFDPPNYSSFFHFATLLYVMPYPSTFSFVAAVAAAWLVQQLLQANTAGRQQLVLFAAFTLLSTVVLLTHPLTFVLLCMLVLMVYLQQAQQRQRRLLAQPVIFLVLAGATAFLLAGLWPWYPFWQLLQYAEVPHRFHADSRELYSNIYLELYPLLLPAVLMALQPRSFWKQQLPFVAALSVAAVLFFYGWFSHKYGWGRMLAFATLVAHVLIVRFVLCTPSRVKGTLILLLTLVLALPYCIQSIGSQVWMLQQSPAKQLSETAPAAQLLPPAALARQLAFVAQQVPAGKMVLANRYCNKYLPGYGLRVAASAFPTYFIPNASELELKVERFFQTTTSPAERARLLQQLQPDAIVLAPDERWLLPELQTRHGWQPERQANGFIVFVPAP